MGKDDTPLAGYVHRDHTSTRYRVPISSRDEIGDWYIEMVDMVLLDTDTVHSTTTSWWLVVRSVCSPTMFCAATGTSTSAQIHVVHDGLTGRP